LSSQQIKLMICKYIMQEPKQLTRKEICTRAGRTSAARRRAKQSEIRERVLQLCANDPELVQLARPQFELMVKAAYRVAEANEAMQRAAESVDACAS
jgi:hypothetical protein